ncbi:MAG TPA: tetratricopeptide repeat protein, partial [Fermentimonas sp.]|nr:tetratricopeptide repeat protein [Fermentimonas sp.]
MDLKYHILLNITLLAAAVLNISCSTGRNTSASRAYHELTTRYNIYHNAEENYTRLLEAQLINSNDKWFELLTFHPGEKSTNKEIPGGPFDAVIDKTAKSIVEHSITAKPRRDPSKAHSTEYRQWLKQEEFNPYIKNSWLLMGKAYVQNGDYNEALSVFKEIQRIFPNEKELIAEAQIWMLRSYVGLNNKFEADNMIYILKSSKIPNDLEPLFNQEHTNYLLFNKQFTEALPYLQKTIDQEKRHLQKKRLQFLQGQIYMLLNKKELALKSFQKVKGIRTPPEVSRHASFYQATITNGVKQNSYFNDSIAQIINHNVSLEHIGSNLAHSVQAPNKANSSNFYIATPIVRVKANKYIGQEHLNKASSVTDLKESYSLLLFLEGNSNLLNQLLFATTNFNFSNFKLRTFKTTPIRISSKQAVKIEPFISLSETTRYLNQIKSDSTFRN